MQKLLNGMMLVLLGATTIAFAQVERLPVGTSVEIRTNEGIDLRDASDGRIFSCSVARDVFDQMAINIPGAKRLLDGPGGRVVQQITAIASDRPKPAVVPR